MSDFACDLTTSVCSGLSTYVGPRHVLVTKHDVIKTEIDKHADADVDPAGDVVP